jgi:hypothetical protein
MRIDIHSHTAPAKYVEAIRRDPKRMGCRIEKDDQGRESIVQDIGRSTRLRASLIDPERRLLRHLHLRPGFAGISHPHNGQRPRPVGHRLSYTDDRCRTGFSDQWHRRTLGGGQREGFGRQCGEAIRFEIEPAHWGRKMIISPL